MTPNPTPGDPNKVTEQNTTPITSIYDPRYPQYVDPKDPNSTNPTAESWFGPTPWVINAGGYDARGQWDSFAPWYFATQETADKLAQMVGGTLVGDPDLTDGLFAGNHPARLIEMPNGTRTNAGQLAAFWAHGWPRSYIEEMVSLAIGTAWKFPDVPVASATPATPTAPPQDHIIPVGFVEQRVHAATPAIDGLVIGFVATSANGSQWRKDVVYTPFGTTFVWVCTQAGA